MAIKAPHYPIIYVRGYAATKDEIEETVATPYMGFNLGATKVRQDYDGEIVRFIFESPLIRLMKDEGYRDTYRNGDLIPSSERVPAKSIWIFRYYEPVSDDLGDGERLIIPRFAADLRKFILRVRDQVCGDDKRLRRSFKVYLVAHSMGGLICRCYLQNICIKGAKDAFDAKSEVKTQNKQLELTKLPADPLVDKVFTYATPHNGIDIAGLNVPNLGALDQLHVRNFNRKYMRSYLNISNGPVNSLHQTFPLDRFFCFIGTNYRDYNAFFGLSKKGTGPMSDGLVMMENASVQNAPRAFAHRSHSGHYGIVNSEEGYQNLRRFLFGDTRVDVSLLADEITLPKVIEEKVGSKRKRVRAAYNIESAAVIRGQNVFLNERRVTQESAIRRTYEKIIHDKKPIYLFSGYLLKKLKSKNSSDSALAFAIEISIQVPVYEIDKRFWLDEHFEGGDIFKEIITFHIRPSAKGTTVHYGLSSVSGIGVAEKQLKHNISDDDGNLYYEIPIGFKEDADTKPRPGFRGRLQVVASRWNADI